MNKKNAGYYIKRISDYIETDTNRELDQYGLTWSQARVMTFLLNRRDRLTIQKDIEDFFEIKHPTVVGIIQRMEAKGFIKSEIDPRDKRQRIITLTDEAYDLEQKISAHYVQAEAKMGAGMTEEEIDTFKQSLYKIYKNITENK